MGGPFLKWAGGKRQLMEDVIANFPANLDDYDVYVEPFLGGGSVLIEVLNRNFSGKVVAGDFNRDIILCYEMIQSQVEPLIQVLNEISQLMPIDLEERKPFYYNLRDEWNRGVANWNKMSLTSKIRRAALTISLNKTCFNGLFRLNSRGLFNVPMGGTKKLNIFVEENLRSLNRLFANVKFVCSDYKEVFDMIKDNENAFFYLDPPYRRLTETSSLTMYNADPFDDAEQLRLRDEIELLVEKGHHFLLSNSDPKNIDNNDLFFDEAYSTFHISRVLARRSINSVASGRGEIYELLIRTHHEIIPRGD
jgi:DNA adenine methylase